MAVARSSGARDARRRKPSRAPQGGGGLVLDPEAIRHWRKQRGFTQEALAEQRTAIDGETVQISYAQLRRIEKSGRAGPASARILAALLGVELALLRPRDPRRLPCGLPREVSVAFVGRSKEVDAVLAILEREGNVRIAASIEGLPGVGKTELALQVCGICDQTRAFRIFWLNAEQPDLTSQWADVVARHLGVEHADPRERSRLAQRLIESSGEPTLLVLDNVERWSASEPWPRPQGAHLRWLVTTRVNRLGERAFEHVEVPVLDPASTAELLLRIAGYDLAQRPGFAELVEFLDGYTIAIELAAAFLGRFPEIDPGQYLKALASGKSDVLEAEVRDRTHYQETLDGALELLWDRMSGAMRGTLELAAGFAQGVVSSALSDAAGLDRKLRAQLRDLHLIQSDPEGWSMHRLVRAFARRRALRPERARSAMILGCAAHLGRANTEEVVSAYLRDRSHLDLAVDLARDVPVDDGDALAELRRGIGEARARISRFPELDSWLRQAAAFFRAKLASGTPGQGSPRPYAHLQQALARSLLAQAFDEARVREAVEACRAAADAYEREGALREWADAQRALGRSLETLGFRADALTPELSLAVEAYRSALRVYTRDEDPLEWARTQLLLGGALTVLGDRTCSSPVCEQAVAALRAALEQISRDREPIAWANAQRALGSALSLLSSNLGSAGLAREAVEACRAALEVQTRSTMPDAWARTQYDLSITLNILGALENDARHLEGAAEAAWLSIEVRTRESAPFMWAMTMDHLTFVLRDLSQHRPEIEILEQAVACARGAFDFFSAQGSVERSALLQSQLGSASFMLAERQGDAAAMERAIELCRAAVAAYPDKVSRLWIDTILNLSEALAALGRQSGEEAPLREALAGYERALAAADPVEFPRLEGSIREQIADLSARLPA